MHIFRVMDHFAITSSFSQRNNGHENGVGNIFEGLSRRFEQQRYSMQWVTQHVVSSPAKSTSLCRMHCRLFLDQKIQGQLVSSDMISMAMQREKQT